MEQTKIVDYNKWNLSLKKDKGRYQTAKPYPHIVIDDFFERDVAEKTLEVFPKVVDKGWIHYVHINEKKHGLNKLDLIPNFIKYHIIKELNSSNFIKYLEELTGIEKLLPDDTFEGGGIHQSERGGFLNIHADFTVHPHKRNWRRRVNVLVYLNKNWDSLYGGDLELWDKNMSSCVLKIAPIFNRVVIFNTNEDSYHGFPDPIKCPLGESRKSIALYYFTEEKPGTFKKKSTNYRPRPQDGLISVLIWIDKQLIALYTALKGKLGWNDNAVSNILKILNRKRNK